MPVSPGAVTGSPVFMPSALPTWSAQLRARGPFKTRKKDLLPARARVDSPQIDAGHSTQAISHQHIPDKIVWRDCGMPEKRCDEAAHAVFLESFTRL